MADFIKKYIMIYSKQYGYFQVMRELFELDLILTMTSDISYDTIQGTPQEEQ